MPEDDDGATSCVGFLETVEEDMIVDFEARVRDIEGHWFNKH